MTGSRNKARCAFCKKEVKKDGKILNSKFYHDVCHDKVLFRLGCDESAESKKIYIAV